ncbi:MAG: hypothetical protein IPM39_03980 [Chloroflexi bacterium]|nr:hypothetical protein [Chloroflexota bacterium]
MAGFVLGDAPEFDDWQFAQVEQLRLAVDAVTVLDQTQPTPWQMTNTWEQVTNERLPAMPVAHACGRGGRATQRQRDGS